MLNQLVRSAQVGARGTHTTRGSGHAHSAHGSGHATQRADRGTPRSERIRYGSGLARSARIGYGSGCAHSTRIRARTQRTDRGTHAGCADRIGIGTRTIAHRSVLTCSVWIVAHTQHTDQRARTRSMRIRAHTQCAASDAASGMHVACRLGHTRKHVPELWFGTPHTHARRSGMQRSTPTCAGWWMGLRPIWLRAPQMW